MTGCDGEQDTDRKQTRERDGDEALLLRETSLLGEADTLPRGQGPPLGLQGERTAPDPRRLSPSASHPPSLFQAGVVRFVGRTELGPGEWCGVELETEDGLNDGAVRGVRYFSCRPRRGLLAPASKVTTPIRFPPTLPK